MIKQKIGGFLAGGFLLMSLGLPNMVSIKPMDSSFSFSGTKSYVKNTPSPEANLAIEWNQKGTNKYTLNHQQEVWLMALEFCESRGYNSAINPRDLDNTPSYSNFQFKPTTLQYYAVKYGLLSDDREFEDWVNLTFEYGLTREIVTRMIGEKGTNWNQQFPACVRQLGFPPKGL